MGLSELQDFTMFELFDQRSRYESIRPQTKKKLNDFLNKLNNDSNYKILFRGTNFGYITEKRSFEEFELLKRVFIVGDKAKRFFDDELKEIFDNNFLESKFNSFKEIDTATILGRLSSDYLQRNAELRALIHFLNKEVEGYDKRADSLVSTTFSLRTALEFANEDYGINQGYIIVSFENQRHIFNTKDLKEIVGKPKSELIDEEKEFMINQAIFPNKIIGIITPEKNFIINPWLVKKLESSEVISDFEIPVDQTLFDKFKKDLGYKNETYDTFRL